MTDCRRNNQFLKAITVVKHFIWQWFCCGAAYVTSDHFATCVETNFTKFSNISFQCKINKFWTAEAATIWYFCDWGENINFCWVRVFDQNSKVWAVKNSVVDCETRTVWRNCFDIRVCKRMASDCCNTFRDVETRDECTIHKLLRNLKQIWRQSNLIDCRKIKVQGSWEVQWCALPEVNRSNVCIVEWVWIDCKTISNKWYFSNRNVFETILFEFRYSIRDDDFVDAAVAKGILSNTDDIDFWNLTRNT